jgi:hypothetical protein
MRTYRVGVARHPAYGKTRGQIRERFRAALVYGTPCLVCSSPMFRRHMLDLHHTMLGLRHTDPAGR